MLRMNTSTGGECPICACIPRAILFFMCIIARKTKGSRKSTSVFENKKRKTDERRSTTAIDGSIQLHGRTKRESIWASNNFSIFLLGDAISRHEG